jgi:hypothetical protein
MAVRLLLAHLLQYPFHAAPFLAKALCRRVLKVAFLAERTRDKTSGPGSILFVGFRLERASAQYCFVAKHQKPFLGAVEDERTLSLVYFQESVRLEDTVADLSFRQAVKASDSFLLFAVQQRGIETEGVNVFVRMIGSFRSREFTFVEPNPEFVPSRDLGRGNNGVIMLIEIRPFEDRGHTYPQRSLDVGL